MTEKEKKPRRRKFAGNASVAPISGCRQSVIELILDRANRTSVPKGKLTNNIKTHIIIQKQSRNSSESKTIAAAHEKFQATSTGNEHLIKH